TSEAGDRQASRSIRNEHWTPIWTPGWADARSLGRQRARNSGPFALSGRLDSNQRPPGPQPEGSSATQLMGPVSIGFLVSEFVPVALNLLPKLFPERVFYRWVGIRAPGGAPDAARILPRGAAACRMPR